MKQGIKFWDKVLPGNPSRKISTQLAAVALMFALPLMAFSCQQWLTTIERDLPVVLQIVGNIVTFAAPGVGTILATAGKVATDGLNVLCGAPQPDGSCSPTSLVGQYKANKNQTTLGEIEATITDVQDHLDSMIATVKSAGANIPDATVATVVKSIALASSTLLAIQSVIPPSALPPAKNARVMARRTVLPRPGTLPILTPSQIKAQFNAIVSESFPQAVIH